MKKTLLALTIASLGLAAVPAAFAQSTHNDGFFINGSVGRAALNHGPYDDHTTGYALNGGYRWAVNPQVALGVEAGYNDLGNIHPKNVFNRSSNRVSPPKPAPAPPPPAARGSCPRSYIWRFLGSESTS